MGAVSRGLNKWGSPVKIRYDGDLAWPSAVPKALDRRREAGMLDDDAIHSFFSY